jgi:hypothetical protein
LQSQEREKREQGTYLHGCTSLDKIYDAISKTKPTGCLDGPRHELDASGHSQLFVQRFKELSRQIRKAGDDSLTSKILDIFDLTLHGGLDAESALSKAQLHHLLDFHHTLLDNIHASDANIDVTLTNVFGNVSCW